VLGVHPAGSSFMVHGVREYAEVRVAIAHLIPVLTIIGWSRYTPMCTISHFDLGAYYTEKGFAVASWGGDGKRSGPHRSSVIKRPVAQSISRTGGDASVITRTGEKSFCGRGQRCSMHENGVAFGFRN
jgi:hypothetical protein